MRPRSLHSAALTRRKRPLTEMKAMPFGASAKAASNIASVSWRAASAACSAVRSSNQAMR